MKKTYIKPAMGKGFLLVESPLLSTSIKTGEDITSGQTVEGDSRRASFWDDSE